MIKDITLGQYYPTDSFLHELDPRTKLIGTFLYMMTLFYWQDIRVYLLAVLFLIPLLFLSNIPISCQLRGLKPVIPIMIFTGILNIFHKGEHIVVSFFGLQITKEGMILTGTVRNVIDFGAFVDIGVKHDGLVHISELSDQFVKNPSDVVSVGDVVKVKVIKIDTERQKVGLSMKI